MNDRRYVDDQRAAEWAERLTDQRKPSKATARRWVTLLLEDRAKDRAEIERLRGVANILADVREGEMSQATKIEWCGAPWPIPNVWLGVSIENQRTADERIPWLLRCPAAVRFVSAEPLLGPLDLRPYLGHVHADAIGAPQLPSGYAPPLNDQPWYRGLDWVIVGGESGPGARPMHPDWACSIRDQCQAAGVPFFFKQWGEWQPAKREATAATNMPFGPRDFHGLGCVDKSNWQGTFAVWCEGPREHEWGWAYVGNPNARPDWHHQVMAGVGKNAAGRLLDGLEWNEMPEVMK